MRLLRDGKKVYKNVPQELIDTLDPVERDIVKGANTFANEDETLAWAQTNPDAKRYLEGIKIPKESPTSMGGKIKNAWGAFVNWARKIIGLPQNDTVDTVLSKVLDVSDRLLTADTLQISEAMPGFLQSQTAQELDLPMQLGTKFKSVLSLFKRESKPGPKPESKPESKPTVEGRVYTYTDDKPKRKRVSISKVVERPEREKFKSASNKAMAEKMFGVRTQNVEDNREAANDAADIFRPEERGTRFMSMVDLKTVANLLGNTERELLGGKNRDTKTPDSVAWNYFKGYMSPESALEGLAWELGVGISTKDSKEFLSWFSRII